MFSMKVLFFKVRWVLSSPLKFIPMHRWKQAGQGRPWDITNTWLICLVGTVVKGRHTWTHRLSMSLLVSNWILPHHLLPCPLIIVSTLRWDPPSKSSGSLHIYIPGDDCWPHLHMAYLIILLPSQVPLTWAPRSGVHAAENHPDPPQTVEVTFGIQKCKNSSVSLPRPSLCLYVWKQAHHILPNPLIWYGLSQ